MYLGIDIGGANLKAIGLNKNKRILFVYYKKCPVWLGTKELEKEISFLNKKINVNNVICGITMTAELCDNFNDRNEGVNKIKAICTKLNCKCLYFNNKTKSLFDFDTNNISIASMNWLSTGSFIQRQVKNALIVDFGSTTTDLVVIKNSKIKNKFFTDFDRINNDELIYTGFTRTPIFSISREVKWKNSIFQIIPEFFSNTADLYRVKLMLPDRVDLFETTDSRNKSIINSLKRVSRNLGIDYKENNLPFILGVVEEIIKIQKQLIFNSIHKLIRFYKLDRTTPIICCGIGKNVIKTFAIEEKFNVCEFGSFLKGSKKNIDHASMHAPAFSCAFLVSFLK